MRKLLICLSIFGLAYWMFLWRTVYSAVSPDARDILVVSDRCSAPDCAVKVVVQSGWRSRVIAHRDDCSIRFAHAVWLQSVVAAYVDASYCGEIRTAYDTATGTQVPFARVEPALRQSIIHEYNVSADELTASDGDLFHWIRYDFLHEGRNRLREEFRQRFRH